MFPQVQDQLWVEQFKVNGDELGARQNWEKYHAAEWFDEAIF